MFGFMACVGITNPNGSALAVGPFSKNAGSASALLGFFQLGVGVVIYAFEPIDKDESHGIAKHCDLLSCQHSEPEGDRPYRTMEFASTAAREHPDFQKLLQTTGTCRLALMITCDDQQPKTAWVDLRLGSDIGDVAVIEVEIDHPPYVIPKLTRYT